MNFQILEHVDKLSPAKEKGRYICPVCGGHNLTIAKDGLRYSCWNHCDRSAIREAIAPGHEGQQTTRSQHNAVKFKKQVKLAPLLPEKINLPRLPQTATDSPRPQKPVFIPKIDKVPQGTVVREIVYDYGGGKTVHRFEWDDPNHPKGRCKTFRQCHINSDGLPEWKKGDEHWSAYRLAEAIATAKASGSALFAVFQEGEQPVEIARQHGLGSSTFQGSNWSEESIYQDVLKIKTECPSIRIIPFLPDNDDTGRQKAEVFKKAVERAGLVPAIIDPVAIYPEILDKGDIKEILAAMNPEEFIRRLEDEIHNAVEARRHEQQLEDAASSNDPDVKIKLALLDLLAETDSIKRLRKRAEICSNYRLSKGEVEEAIRELKQQTITTKPLVFALNEFLSQTSVALEFVVPGMLPVGETALLVGTPGCGKTSLAVDLAFAVATGEADFLGETVQQGRVLLISADESSTSTRAKLLRRGFRQEDGDNLRVMPSFDMTQLSVLEQQLEDFRPTLVIVDSLRRINHGGNISENSAEFADNLYTLKELLQRYKAAGLVIHHCGKSKEAVGVDKVRGSGAIAGAVWGVWNLEQIVKLVEIDGIKKQIVDPTDSNRIFSIPKARDCEGQTVKVELDPENLHWLNRGSGGDSQVLVEQRTRQQKILDLLRQFAPNGLEGSEIRDLVGLDKSVYSDLNRLVGKRQITQRPSQKDKRRTVYVLPNAQENSPSPTPYVTDAIQSNETYIQQEFQDRSQIDHKLIADRSQEICDPPPAIQPNSNSVSIPAMDHTLETHRGGEGVFPTVIHFASDVRNDLQPTPAKGIERQIEVGSKVHKRKNFGWTGIVQEITGNKAKVLWHQDLFPVDMPIKDLRLPE